MTDIDFDELDKAVSATLGSRAEKKDETSPAGGAAVTPPEPSEAPVKADDTKRPMIQVQKRQTIVSPAAKRSGRFMDMVHPSSDMAQEKAISPASKVKIMPTENAPKPEPKPVASVEEVANVEAETTKVSEVPEAPASNDPVYPDPLDVMEPVETADQKEDAPVAAEPETTETPPEASDTEAKAAPEAVEPPAPAAPSAPVAAGETPFIPDAKVEKRPLGGVAPTEPVPSDEALSQPAPEASEQDTQLPPETSLPPALQSDVVAVESDVVSEANGGIPGLSDAEEAAAAVKQAAESELPEKKAEPASLTPEPVSTTVSMAESIPQQYRSSAEPADETLRPVFDTEQYHQPLIPAHTGHKNHTFLFILLILALLIVGAGLGYFAYVSGF